MYERGNAAKQFIFTRLEGHVKDKGCRILDVACGDGRLWSSFLDAHPATSVLGIDTNEQAIKRGKEQYTRSQLELRLLDAQKPLKEKEFDVVVALSAVEHIVDRSGFLHTVWDALRSGGYAYLNYDVGHFRSRDIKERIMVPVSQLLALLGIEGPYMKKVDDKKIIAQAKEQGFIVEGVQKHNLYPLKGFFRGATDEALAAWMDFEEKLNGLYDAQTLDKIMWSTTLLLKKP